jgi:hypothetical protein
VDIVRAATRVLVQTAVTGAAVIKAVRDASRANSIGRPATTSSRTHPRLCGQRMLAMSAEMHAGDSPLSFDAVRFRREGERLCVEHAPPVMWFARHVLEHSQANPDVGLSFDGTHVTLNASNGQWIWKLSGRSWFRSAGPDVEPLVMLEGIWPD